MSETFYLENGKEVHFGDEISVENSVSTDLGLIRKVSYCTVTSSNVDKLISKGILYTTKIDYKVIRNIHDCLTLIAKENNISEKEVTNLYNTLLKICPTAAFTLILKTISNNLEKKYNGALSELVYLFGIRNVDGEVVCIPGGMYDIYDGVAVFRTSKDAHDARDICAPICKIIYGK